MDEDCHVEPLEKAVTLQQIQAASRAILSIGGMGCPNCAMRVHNSLVAVNGVYRADVYLKIGLAEVYYDRNKVSADVLTQVVQHAGTAVRHDYHALVIAAD